MTAEDLRARTGLDPALADGLLAATAPATTLREAINQAQRLREQRHLTELLTAQQPQHPPFLEHSVAEVEAVSDQPAGINPALAEPSDSVLLTAGLGTQVAVPAEELVQSAPAPLGPVDEGFWSLGKRWLTRLFQ